MTVRPIDGKALLKELRRNFAGTPFHGNRKVTIGEVRRIIESMPTLTPQNEPLTLDELREMDGEPVYIISEFYDISEWNIPNGIGEIVIAYDAPYIKFIDGTKLAVEKYGSSWVAYRRPPEGEPDA